MSDSVAVAALVGMRAKVARILANNLLPHFTDHSVAHSDRMVAIAGSLIERIQRGVHPLNDRELTVLYGACYLHDVGLQYENVHEIPIIQDAMSAGGLAVEWAGLSPGTRRGMLRDHHHLISAWMVMNSVRGGKAVLGVQLGPELLPERIASLCEAHCTESDSARYKQLTEVGPDMRMDVLSALLRLADILDESQRRADPAKARTLDLTPEERLHWARLYYTEDITVDAVKEEICIWFDFPEDHIAEYKRVIPELQVPCIEEELGHHAMLLKRHGVHWSLQYKVVVKSYSTTEALDDRVWAEMLQIVNRRRMAAAEERRSAALGCFRVGQPWIRHRLETLAEQKESMPVTEYLRDLRDIANDMRSLGGKRSAWISLHGPYMQYAEQLGVSDRLDVGTSLAEMMADDDEWDMAARVLRDLESSSGSLDEGRRFEYWKLRATCSFLTCSDRTVEDIGRALKCAPDKEQASCLQALLAEWHLLQTDLTAASSTAVEGV